MQRREKSNARRSTNVHFSDRAAELACSFVAKPPPSWVLSVPLIRWRFLLRFPPACLLNPRGLQAAVRLRLTGESFGKHLKIISGHTDWNNQSRRTRGARITGLKFHGKRQKSRCWFILTTAAVLPCEPNRAVIVPNMRPKHTLTPTAVFY